MRFSLAIITGFSPQRMNSTKSLRKMCDAWRRNISLTKTARWQRWFPSRQIRKEAAMNVNRKIKPSFLTAILLGATLTSFASVPVSANDQLKLPPVKKVKLKNGMTLLLMERHGVPIVSFNVIVKAGSVADPVGKEGLAAITADMLKKGTKARTEDQISEQTDF